MTAPNDLSIRRALETAGVEFIDGNGGGPGCAYVRRINAENANNMTCHYDPSGRPAPSSAGVLKNLARLSPQARCRARPRCRGEGGFPGEKFLDCHMSQTAVPRKQVDLGGIDSA